MRVLLIFLALCVIMAVLGFQTKNSPKRRGWSNFMLGVLVAAVILATQLDKPLDLIAFALVIGSGISGYLVARYKTKRPVTTTEPAADTEPTNPYALHKEYRGPSEDDVHVV